MHQFARPSSFPNTKQRKGCASAPELATSCCFQRRTMQPWARTSKMSLIGDVGGSKSQCSTAALVCFVLTILNWKQLLWLTPILAMANPKMWHISYGLHWQHWSDDHHRLNCMLVQFVDHDRNILGHLQPIIDSRLQEDWSNHSSQPGSTVVLQVWPKTRCGDDHCLPQTWWVVATVPERL